MFVDVCSRPNRLHVIVIDSLIDIVICSREMDGSCAMSQGSAACDLTVGDGDTLNVEHELSRWLLELDNSVSLSYGCHFCILRHLKSSELRHSKIARGVPSTQKAVGDTLGLK